jgi:hypothetical protein
LPGRTFSRDGGSAPDAPEAGALCRSSDPLSGRSDSRVIVLCLPRHTDTRSREAARIHALEYCIRSDEGRGQASLLFPYGRPLSRKENPPWDPHRRLLARLRCRSATTRFTGPVGHNPCPGPGILTWFPFAGRCDALREEGDDRDVFYAPRPPDRTPLYGPYPIA